MRFRDTLAALVLSFVGMTGGSAQAGDMTLSGTVSYLDRSALPPGAVLDVELVDVSRADVASVQLSSRRYSIDHVPFPFQLTYDASLVDPRFTYAIQARISQGGKVLYRSTSHYPALTRNAPETVDVVVDRMPEPTGSRLVPSTWEVSEIGGRLLVTDKRPTISFLPDDMVAVYTGCNRFRGPVEIANGTLRFSDKMAGTLMACSPPYDQLERDVLDLLPQVSGFDQSRDHLSLTNRAGVVVMRLNRSN